MSNVKDMTKGSCWKLITIFAIPIFLSNLFQQLYNSVDSLIVGNYLGDEAYAAVASSGNLIFLFTSFFIGTSTGAGVIISKYFGEKNYDSMHKAIHTDIAFGLVASILLTVLGVTLTPYILKLMNTDPTVLPESTKYFRSYFIGATGVIMYNIFNGILQAVGNSRRPLLYLIISSIFNVILDLIFIAGLGLGVEWAAVATALSQLLSALFCLLFLMKKNTVYQVKLKDIKFDSLMLKNILYYGVPAGVQNSVIGFANVVVQSNINSFGADAMAGCGTYSKLEGFVFLPITCFMLAITTFVGQNLGAKEYDRAKKGSMFGIIASVVMACMIGIFMYFNCEFFIRLFTKNDNAVAIAKREFRTISLFYGLLAFSHCIASVCRGAGKAIIPMLIMLLVWCVFRVSYITVIMRFKDDIVYVFWAYPITWSISSVIYLFYYLFCDWIHGFEKKELRQD